MAHLPQCRVKTIMKTSEECLLISKESLIITVKAAEMFIKELACEAYNTNKTKKITYNHVVDAVEETRRFNFLQNIVPRKITVRQFKKIMAAKKKGTPVESSSSSEETSSSSSSDDEEDEEKKQTVVDIHVTADSDNRAGSVEIVEIPDIDPDADTVMELAEDAILKVPSPPKPVKVMVIDDEISVISDTDDTDNV